MIILSFIVILLLATSVLTPVVLYGGEYALGIEGVYFTTRLVGGYARQLIGAGVQHLALDDLASWVVFFVSPLGISLSLNFFFVLPLVAKMSEFKQSIRDVIALHQAQTPAVPISLLSSSLAVLLVLVCVLRAVGPRILWQGFFYGGICFLFCGFVFFVLHQGGLVISPALAEHGLPFLWNSLHSVRTSRFSESIRPFLGLENTPGVERVVMFLLLILVGYAGVELDNMMHGDPTFTISAISVILRIGLSMIRAIINFVLRYLKAIFVKTSLLFSAGRRFTQEVGFALLRSCISLQYRFSKVVSFLWSLLTAAVHQVASMLYAVPTVLIASAFAGVRFAWKHRDHINLASLLLMWSVLAYSLVADHWASLWTLAAITVWSLLLLCMPSPRATEDIMKPIVNTGHIVPMQLEPVIRPARFRSRTGSSSDGEYLAIDTQRKGKARLVDDDAGSSLRTPPRTIAAPHASPSSASASPSVLPDLKNIKDARRELVTIAELHDGPSATAASGTGEGSSTLHDSNSFQARAPLTPDARLVMKKAGRRGERAGLVIAHTSVAFSSVDEDSGCS
ncbi:hypothetical protein B0H11DRAFT_2291429 [Mycena galericulata]|nr:hypothetical protein B0H11DRAFT_2291429 [Mycena galericulata]